MEQLCDREREWYGRIFRNLITLYVAHTKRGSEREREPTDLGIAAHSSELASPLQANP
jgi:hypothetical protein